MNSFDILITALAGIGAIVVLAALTIAACLFFIWVYSAKAEEEEEGYDEEAELLWRAKNYNPETGERRREFSEPSTDARFEGREILAPSPQQYSALPAQWSLNDDAWLPPLPESAYTPESTPLPAHALGSAAPGINGQPVLEETSDAQATA